MTPTLHGLGKRRHELHGNLFSGSWYLINTKEQVYYIYSRRPCKPWLITEIKNIIYSGAKVHALMPGSHYSDLSPRNRRFLGEKSARNQHGSHYTDFSAISR